MSMDGTCLINAPRHGLVLIRLLPELIGVNCRFAMEVSKMMEGAVEALDPDDVNLAMQTEQDLRDHGTVVDLTTPSPEICQIEREREMNVERNMRMMETIGR